MSKRIIKSIILLLIFSFYPFIKKIFLENIVPKYSLTIAVIFMIILLFLSIKLLGFQKNRNSIINKEINRDTIISTIIYIIIFYGIGIYKGITNNLNKNSFEALLLSLIIIITVELFRYIIIKANKDKKSIIIISTISIIFFESIILNKNTYDLITISLSNVLISYINYYIDFVPGIIYKVLINIFIYITPSIANMNSTLNVVLNILYLLVAYIYITKKIKKYYKDNNENNQIKKVLIEGCVISFLLIIVLLSSSIFPYYMIGIGSGSMNPELLVGDAVIVRKKTSKDTIKKDDIITYKVNNNEIVHRVVKIETINNITYYRTKGDANNTVDSINITDDDIYGIVKARIPYIAIPTVYIDKLLNGGNRNE